MAPQAGTFICTCFYCSKELGILSVRTWVALSARPAVMAAWRRIVARAGFDAVAQAQDLRPVNLSDGYCGLGGYFVKAGWDAAAEIACGASKTARSGNLTPMAILRRFAQDGDADDLQRWHEWEAASRGRQQMTWSRGLRARLRLLTPEPDDALAATADDGAEQTDEEIAAAQDHGDGVLLILDAMTWCRVRSGELLWLLLETAERTRRPRVTCADLISSVNSRLL